MSDDKTRILTPADLERLTALADAPADQTAILTPEQLAQIDQAVRTGERPAAAARRPATREPTFAGDKIIFFCPKGHRLIVAAAHAGKRGRCDKAGCGEPVVIPTPPVEPPVAAEPEAAEPEAAAPAEGGAEPTVPEFAFEAPRSEAGAATADAPAAGEPPAESAEGWAPPGDAPAAAEGLVMEEGSGAEAEAALAWDEVDGSGDAYDNPTARLVARLWMETKHGGVVELHLTGGSVIVPDAYEQRWSRGTHGLFASQAADGTVTLTAVAWDTVQKVIVRQVKGLPYGMFE